MASRLNPLLALAAAFCIAPAAGADGKALYEQNCAGCHQPNGEGVPGLFPPLANRLSAWYAQPPGREYLAQVVLNGRYGGLKIDGVTYSGFMPTFNHLPPADLAATLNYVAESLNTPANGYQPLTEQDLAAWKAAPKRDAALTALRDALKP